MKPLTDKRKISPIAVVLLGVLLVYFFFICYLNLSLAPSFYCTDMYSDILYSVRAWEAKSIFPDGWVFGNQFYVIATPVLASLIYGIVGHPALAMGIASCLMTVGIIISFLWMMKPVFPKLEERLLAVLFLIILPAWRGNAIISLKGWQLFFTMCSYYACYLITAFLVFGIFLRRGEKLTKPRIVLLVIALLLSFGAGMQSLRQTAVMLPPILAVEGFMLIKNLIKREKIKLQPILITAAVTVSNLLGVLVIRLMDIPQNEIFTAMKPLKGSELPESVNTWLTHMANLLAEKSHYGILLLIVAAVAILAVLQSRRQKEALPNGWISLISLFVVSVAGISFLDLFTKMSIRHIYYFMLIPLLAILPAFAYRRWKFGRIITLSLLALLTIVSFKNAVLPSAKTARDAEKNASYEISELLIEKGYTTVYSAWNQAEDIAIASGGKLTAGFWNSSKDVFNSVLYLCDPSVYEVEPNKCVYYLKKDNRDIALEEAKKRGVEMTLVAEVPTWNIWFYEADENLMKPAGE